MTSIAERIVEKAAGRAGVSRRGFLAGATVAGAAMTVAPWKYVTQPASAYDAVCGTHANCNDGYTVMCCTVNAGQNSCPPNTFVGGWWKADNASFCGGAARYYIDCNAYANNNTFPCRCSDDPNTCDHRRFSCNQFRYGQCSPNVPWSNTGPVVCRVVSCTPPWVEYAGVCSSASLTDNKTVSHTAPCLPPGRAPMGNLDATAVGPWYLRMTGWALDLDAAARATNVALYIDSQGISWYPTSVLRPDVNSAFSTSGTHGFDIATLIAPGQHLIQLYAINLGAPRDNPLIGSAVVTVPDWSPVGQIDSMTAGRDSVTVGGWAYDPDAPSASIDIEVLVDDVSRGVFPANLARPDVNSALGIPGDHGYSITVPATPGLHRVAVVARNVGGPAPGTVLGQRTLEVNAGKPPVGRFDSAVAVNGNVRLTGWAYDPDEPATEIKVAIYRDGGGIAWFPTGVARPDVNQHFGITGNHGFDITLPTAPGSYTFEVYGINVGGGNINPLLDRRVVPVAQVAFGNFEAVGVSGSTVRVVGWGMDSQNRSAQIEVELVVDGGPATRLLTTVDRPDVNAAFGTTGTHGFDGSLTLTPGAHTITAYAVALGGGKAVIGQHTATV